MHEFRYNDLSDSNKALIGKIQIRKMVDPTGVPYDFEVILPPEIATFRFKFIENQDLFRLDYNSIAENIAFSFGRNYAKELTLFTIAITNAVTEYTVLQNKGNLTEAEDEAALEGLGLLHMAQAVVALGYLK